MSAIDFQRVMAHFIRFPSAPYEEVLGNLGSVDLSEREEKQLRQMAVDPLVRKFGAKMSYIRQRDSTEVMKLSKDFIPPNLLRKLFAEHFEPTRTQTNFVMGGVQFLEFLLKDQTSQELLKEAPPFLGDLLRYDLAKAIMIRTLPDLSKVVLPSGSYLQHDSFKILDVVYDVPQIDQMKTVDAASRKAPKEKKLKLLFIGWAVPPYYRMFQIDDTIEAFLFAQLKDPKWWKGDLPKAHAAMVKVGLCTEEARA